MLRGLFGWSRSVPSITCTCATLMKRILCIEVHYDDGREQPQRASSSAKQAEVAARAAAKAAACAALRSAGMKVTETTSSSRFDDHQ
jgi:hypothetical protein